MNALTTLGLSESIRSGWPVTWLVYFDHPDGEVRLWSGVGDLVYGGDTYQGVGHLGRIVGVGGAKKLAVRQIQLELSGIPVQATRWLNKDVRGRVARAWVAGLDRDGTRVNGMPWQVIDGVADYQELPLSDDGSVAVRVHINEPVFEMERAQNLAWTSEWINEKYGSQDLEFSSAAALFTTTLASDDDVTPHGDRSIRQVFRLPGDGVLHHQMRFRLTSTAAGTTNIDNLSVGRFNTTWETQSVPIEVKTTGASGITVGPGQSLFTDWSDFVHRDDDAIVAIMDIGSASSIKFTPGAFETYFKENDDTFNERAPTGLAPTPGPWSIDRIESRSIIQITGLDLIPSLANAAKNWTLT
jgi:hypothetical protein